MTQHPKHFNNKIMVKLNKIIKLPKYVYKSLKCDLSKLQPYNALRKPKIAFCIFGLVGGVKGKSGENLAGSEEVLNIGFDHYKKHIFEKNSNIDVFIHTWNIDLKEQIVKLYKPKKSEFQTQISFEVPDYVKGEYRRKQNHYSRWYSTKKVIELKTQYEKENDFEYDLIFLTRFDIAWEKDLDFSKIDPQYFYVADYFQVKPLLGLFQWRSGYPYQEEGLADLWFISNSENMNIFSTLYDYLNKYTDTGNCPYSPNTGISNHNLVSYHLKQKAIIKKLRFIFEHYGPDEVDPLVRKKYFGINIINIKEDLKFISKN